MVIPVLGRKGVRPMVWGSVHVVMAVLVQLCQCVCVGLKNIVVTVSAAPDSP